MRNGAKNHHRYKKSINESHLIAGALWMQSSWYVTRVE
uniref:Uncharacterized protein n=1 Tax=Escherichia coli TaxID=562 RepID=A0A649Z464_ECOLX|nr:hypothetical protein [Escherichia coli]